MGDTKRRGAHHRPRDVRRAKPRAAFQEKRMSETETRRAQYASAETRSGPLPADEARLINAWWRAANYLSVGQIYLLDNPLLREPLRLEHIKPRLLGHWGTTPGLNFVYVHLNRV